MARTVLTLQETVREGLEVTYAAGDSTNNHSWDNINQDIIIHVKNGATDVVCTFVTPQTVDGLAVADQVVTVPATEERFFGPFRNDLYGQAEPDAGFAKSVFLDLDDATNVTLAAIQIGDVNF